MRQGGALTSGAGCVVERGCREVLLSFALFLEMNKRNREASSDDAVKIVVM